MDDVVEDDLDDLDDLDNDLDVDHVVDVGEDEQDDPGDK